VNGTSFLRYRALRMRDRGRNWGGALVALLVGCQGEVADDPTEAGVEDAAADGAVEVSETGTDAITADPCGVVGCEASKVFHPRIREAFDRLGGATVLGAPTDNGGTQWVHAFGSGMVQDFAGGSLGPVILAESSSTAPWAAQAYAIHGPIRAAWLALGAPAVGHPKEDAHPLGGGVTALVQTFEKGCLGPDGRGGYELYEACTPPPDLAPTLAKIGAQFPTSSGGADLAVAVTWLPTLTRWSHQGAVPRTSASSVKWVWAAAALARNSIATVETPALPTFEDSNNSTAGQLIDLAGGPNAVNDFTVALGIPITQLSLCGWSFDKTRVATNCSKLAGGDNFFTAVGAVTFLEKVWAGAGLPADKASKLAAWATLSPRSGYGGWVGTQLPAAVRPGLQHKAGWLPTGCCSAGYPAFYNEFAIVRTSRGSYAFAASAKNGGATRNDTKQTKALEWASCVVFHALAEPSGDPFSAGCTP